MKLRLRGGIQFSTAFVVLFLALAPRADAQSPDREIEPLADLWTSPAPFKKSSPSSVSVDVAQADNRLIFLVSGRDESFLMPDINQTGPGQLIPLATRGWSLRLASGLGDTLWIGGLRNPGRSIFGAPVSDAYLAKINRKGQIIWEREYGRRDEKSVETLAALPPSGDVVVAGKYNGKTWLARIGADGRIIWNQAVGMDRGSSLVVTADKILLAAFEAASKNPQGSHHEIYRVDVTLWTFDHNGRQLDKRTIREAIAHQNYGWNAYLGRIATKSTGDAVYIFSVWSGGFGGDGLKPLAVTRIDASGQPAWQTELPQTVVEFRGRMSPCLERIEVLANGDPLVACARAKGMQLIRLNAQTGEATESLVPALPPSPSPHCERGRASTMTVSQAADMSLWLFGATPDCTWLGRIAPSQVPTRDSRPRRGQEKSLPL